MALRKKFLIETTGAPISRRLLFSFIAVTMIPAFAVSVWVYRVAWNNAQQEFPEKHGLLARSLAPPLFEYLDKHRNMLVLMADRIADSYQRYDTDYIAHVLEDTLDFYPALHLLAVVEKTPKGEEQFVVGITRDNDGTLRRISHYPSDVRMSEFIIDHPDSLHVEQGISGLIPSLLNQQPAILLDASHETTSGTVIRLVAELGTNDVETLRKTVHFGKMGHAAIFDQYGRVIAHPNAQWVSEMKDLSEVAVIKKMLTNETGVDHFNVAEFNQDFVAGYAKVPSFGWGIMVMQPYSEIEEQVEGYIIRDMVWVFSGALIAALFSLYLTVWITRPINRLATAAQAIYDDKLIVPFDQVSSRVPREINQLNTVLNRLITRLSDRHNQIESLAEHIPLVFLIADGDGAIRFATGRMLALWQLTPQTALESSLQKVFASRTDTYELMDKLRKGQQRWLTVSVDPGIVIDCWFSPKLDANGQLEKIFVVGNDVSDTHIATHTAQLLDDNRRLLQRALTAEEDERQRLARELHDQLGQDLAATRNYATAIRQTAEEDFAALKGPHHTSAEAIQEYSRHILDIVAHLQSTIRSMLERLRPETLDELGLIDAIREMMASIRTQVPDVDLNVNDKIATSLTDSKLKICLYRIAQECLTNIAKHAKAEHVEISLTLEENPDDTSAAKHVKLVVWDDGCGFYADHPSTGFGIMGMRERMAAINGKLDVSSVPGHGCTITATAPVPA